MNKKLSILCLTLLTIVSRSGIAAAVGTQPTPATNILINELAEQYPLDSETDAKSLENLKRTIYYPVLVDVICHPPTA